MVVSDEEPEITYTPASVIVMSLPSSTVICAAPLRSAFCTISRSVNKSVASIAPLEVTLAFVLDSEYSLEDVTTASTVST